MSVNGEPRLAIERVLRSYGETMTIDELYFCAGAPDGRENRAAWYQALSRLVRRGRVVREVERYRDRSGVVRRRFAYRRMR